MLPGRDARAGGNALVGHRAVRPVPVSVAAAAPVGFEDAVAVPIIAISLNSSGPEGHGGDTALRVVGVTVVEVVGDHIACGIVNQSSKRDDIIYSLSKSKNSMSRNRDVGPPGNGCGAAFAGTYTRGRAGKAGGVRADASHTHPCEERKDGAPGFSAD